MSLFEWSLLLQSFSDIGIELHHAAQKKAHAQPLYSTTVPKNDKTALALYQSKLRNNIPVMSTMQPTVAINGDTMRKPDPMTRYIQAKACQYYMIRIAIYI